MATIRFRSPVTTPLYRSGCTPASDAFCVTQRFGDPDFYWSNLPNPPNPLPTHRAVDIGNFRCGYPIVAMAPGIARRVQDNATQFGAATNALGIEIDHGQGVKTAYWHLASWTAAHGARVAAGQEIGKLGATGLGATCHTHITHTINGVLRDPEPLMFGGSVTIGGEDVDLPNGLVPLAQGVVGPGNRLRVDPATTDGSRVIGGPAPTGIGEAKSYFVQVYGGKPGPSYTLGGVTDSDWLWVGVFDKTWFVAAPLVTNIDLTGAGRALLPTPAPVIQGEPVGSRLAGFRDAKTKAKVASATAIEGIKP